MKIGHLIIATNRYIEFAKPLINSSIKYFLPSHNVTTFLFTNMSFNMKDVICIDQEHHPWPGMTLRRYEIILKNKDVISNMDYIFYTDVDMLFVNSIGDEILGDLVATVHPGYYNSPPKDMPHETDIKSKAYVQLSDRKKYYAGGFNGGKKDTFFNMATSICENIKKDLEWGYIAKWHDESHLNRYLIDHPPSITLDPSYCFPKDHPMAAHHPYRSSMKLCALEKNHKEYQT